MLSEKHAGVLVETHSLHWMQQPLERSLKIRRRMINGKVLSYVQERHPFPSQTLHMAAVFPGSDAPQSCLQWTRSLCVAAGCSAKLASTWSFCKGPEGPLQILLRLCPPVFNQVILSSALVAACAGEDLVCAVVLVVGMSILKML